jgi:uncharacterized membrane protein (UPF0127 family)
VRARSQAPEGLRVRNVTRSTVLAERCRVADDLVTRGVGLLLRPSIRSGEGLLLTKTATITMLGMRFPIDVVFIDRAWRVAGVGQTVAPWTLMRSCRGAEATLELPAGTVAATGTDVGDQLAADR